MTRTNDQALSSILASVEADPTRLAEILDEEPQPLLAFTADRTILAANASAERFFGYGRHELDCRPTDDIVPERFRQPNAPPQLATRDLTTVELPGLRKDGTEIATVWTYGFAPSPGGPLFVLAVVDREEVRKALDSLHRSDARYRSVLVASAAIIWVTSANGEFSEPQFAWEGYTGQSWEKHKGFGWVLALHPEDRARIVEDWTTTVRLQSDHYRTHGRVWSKEHQAWRAFQARGVPVRSTDGKIIEWIGALTDVQDVIDAQEKIARRERELELRFRAIYENALDGILLSNDEPCIVDANPAACRLLGRTREQLIGTSPVELMPQGDRDETPGRLGEFRARGTMTGEGKMVLPDGTVRRAEFGAVANVSPGIHLSVFRDIEDRKRAEEAQQFLDEASRLLTASLDYDETLASLVRLAVPRISDWASVELLEDDGSFRRVAVAHVDPKKVELADELRRRQEPTIHDPTGLGAAVRTGKPELVELVTDEVLTAALSHDPEILRIVRGLGLVSGMVVPLTVRGKITGALSFVSAESRRRYGASDLAVASELSRRAALAIENALYVRELALATRKKDEFLAMLGHELRNPLAPIVTATSLIRSRGKATPRELDILERQARHLVRLVDDLLDIARIVSGKLSLTRTRVELGEILAHAIENAAPTMEEKRLAFFADVAGPPILVEGDRERLVQVVTNVLVNAAKFTPAGKSVFLAAVARDDRAVLTVRDEGQGIVSELLPQVFDLFTQGQQSTDRRSGGLGLGLSIARSIVLAHGGSIEVTSPGPAHGTTVTVTLPLLESAQSESSVAPGGEEALAPATRKHRVLIVDDNGDSAELLAAFLGEVGYEAFVAGNAAQALSIAEKLEPHAAILDIGLPDVDGYELASALRSALGPRTPKLIALTGYAQDKDRERAFASGFVEHMAKPVELTQLVRALHELLRVSDGQNGNGTPVSRVSRSSLENQEPYER